MSAELIGTATGHGADPTRLGSNVLVCKCGTPVLRSLSEVLFYRCLTVATVSSIKLKCSSTGKFHFYLRNLARSTEKQHQQEY